ncbi:hypothetical protein IY145_25125 [Methylosinus sp. H3A]|uniref:hypothetical protein n=1 Tax=Methylosinus sp. H3A TaxID=2785786 RepID=UPI0018C1D473|nr:hypothetical protein [Methylosinus sp. H3A]MBG0812603.1 hypothetical protein [Methylosinus sp. H3A]
MESRKDGDWVVMPRGATGMAFFGPNMPLPAGRHRIGFTIEPQEGVEGVIAICDVCFGPEGTTLRTREVTAGMTEVTIEIELPSIHFGCQFRCYTSTGGFAVKRDISLVSDI